MSCDKVRTKIMATMTVKNTTIIVLFVIENQWILSSCDKKNYIYVNIRIHRRWRKVGVDMSRTPSPRHVEYIDTYKYMYIRTRSTHRIALEEDVPAVGPGRRAVLPLHVVREYYLC